jgi:hypothetical protein
MIYTNINFIDDILSDSFRDIVHEILERQSWLLNTHNAELVGMLRRLSRAELRIVLRALDIDTNIYETERFIQFCDNYHSGDFLNHIGVIFVNASRVENSDKWFDVRKLWRSALASGRPSIEDMERTRLGARRPNPSDTRTIFRKRQAARKRTSGHSKRLPMKGTASSESSSGSSSSSGCSSSCSSNGNSKTPN